MRGPAELQKALVGEGYGMGTERATRSQAAAPQHPRWLLTGASPGLSYGPPFPNPRVQGEREEDEGVPFRRLQAWERGWEEAGHGRP